MNAKKEVWFLVAPNGNVTDVLQSAPSPERECSLLEQGFAVYRRYVDLPETRPTTLRNLQAEENANLRKQVAEGKERMAELRAECDRLTSAPVSQLRANLDFMRAENAVLAKNLQGARESVNGQTRALTQVTVEAQTLRAELHEMSQSLSMAEAWRQTVANELSSVKDQLRSTSHELYRQTAALSEATSSKHEALLAHQRLVKAVYGSALPNVKALLTDIRNRLGGSQFLTLSEERNYISRINAALSLLP